MTTPELPPLPVVAYLYHDGESAETLSPLLHSIGLVVASDRRKEWRNETPLTTLAHAESARAPLVAEVEKLRQTVAWLRGLIATVVERMEREDGPGPDAPGHCHETPGVWDMDNRREIAGKPCEWCHIWAEFKAAGAGKVETCDWCWKSVAEHGNG